MRWSWLLLPLFGLACGSNPTLAPTPIPACQTNNSAQVSLSNTSVERFTFDVLIDNVLEQAVAVNQTAGPFTVSAGVAHTVVARVTNTTTVACSSSPSFVQCSSQTLTCAY